LGDDFDACPEAGWVLTPEAQGHGLAGEATKAAHDWYDRVIPGPLVAIVTEDNLASRSVAERLGYRLLRRAEMGGEAVLLLRRDGPPSP
jgi:RimJ/RimL family protein N-acetyltransferase